MSAEQDKGRAQRHHDELVISINAGKKDLREKTKERGAAVDANRKAGYAALLVLTQLHNVQTRISYLHLFLRLDFHCRDDVSQ